MKSSTYPLNRHAELVSASISPSGLERCAASGLTARSLSSFSSGHAAGWTLKQVQGDEFVGVGEVSADQTLLPALDFVFDDGSVHSRGEHD